LITYIGFMPKDAANTRSEEEQEPFDLAERLTRYRARVEREGRQSAIERLDRAIEEARRKGPKRGGA
jgi:hypothetical protein